MSDQPAKRPLAGIRVLDLSRGTMTDVGAQAL